MSGRMYLPRTFERELEKLKERVMDNTMQQAGEARHKPTPKSIFDLEGEWLRLLQMSHQGYDSETGEFLEPEDIDKAFANLAGDVEHKVAGCGFVLLRLKKDAEMVDEEAKRLATKKKRIEAGRERLEERVRELMKMTKTPTVKKPGISVTLSKASMNKVEITNERKIPDKYMSLPVTPLPKPIMAAIKKALKDNENVPGAKLVESKRTLTVR